MWKQMIPGLRMMILLTVLTGLVYPSLVTAICQAVFPKQANGSLLVRNGKVAGSALLGQTFQSARYFHSRPSAAGAGGYDASSSSGSNLGPASRKLAERVQADKQAAGLTHAVPSDMLTASGSGLDPHISPANARLQIARVSSARGVSESGMRKLVDQFTEGREFGLLGEPRVNVLLLNLALDEQYPNQ